MLTQHAWPHKGGGGVSAVTLPEPTDHKAMGSRRTAEGGVNRPPHGARPAFSDDVGVVPMPPRLGSLAFSGRSGAGAGARSGKAVSDCASSGDGTVRKERGRGPKVCAGGSPLHCGDAVAVEAALRARGTVGVSAADGASLCVGESRE